MGSRNGIRDEFVDDDDEDDDEVGSLWYVWCLVWCLECVSLPQDDDDDELDDDDDASDEQF